MVRKPYFVFLLRLSTLSFYIVFSIPASTPSAEDEARFLRFLQDLVLEIQIRRAVEPTPHHASSSSTTIPSPVRHGEARFRRRARSAISLPPP